MTALNGEGRVLLCNVIHRLLLFVDAGRRLDSGAEDDRHSVGDAAVDARVVVGGRDHRIALHAEGIVGLRAFQVGEAEAGAELNALHGRHRKRHVGNKALHAVKIRLAHTGGQAENGCFKDAAHAVALRTGGTDGRFHRLFDGSIQQGEALVPAFQHAHLSSQCGGIVQRKGRIGNAGTAGDVGGDVDAGAVQRTQHDGTACHQRGSDAARKVSTAPGVLKAVVFGVGGIVRVAGAEQVSRLGVVAAAGVLVLDHQGDGRAGGVTVHDAGEQLNFIGLHTGRRKPIAPGAALIHAGGNEFLIHRHTSGHAVQHTADGPAVALAEDGQRQCAAKGVFHGFSPPCPAGGADPPPGWSPRASSPDPAP